MLWSGLVWSGVVWCGMVVAAATAVRLVGGSCDLLPHSRNTAFYKQIIAATLWTTMIEGLKGRLTVGKDD